MSALSPTSSTYQPLPHVAYRQTVKTVAGPRDGQQLNGSTAPEVKSAGTIPKTTDSVSKKDSQVESAVARLKSTEEKVKAHEAAHKAAGGAITGPVSYTYTRGPDGRNYITGGEVPIDVSAGRTPQETISRMQQVIQAALAPADPSPQDRAVAGQAAARQQEARQEEAEVSAAAVSSANGSRPVENSSGDPAAAARAQQAYRDQQVATTKMTATVPHPINQKTVPPPSEPISAAIASPPSSISSATGSGSPFSRYA